MNFPKRIIGPWLYYQSKTTSEIILSNQLSEYSKDILSDFISTYRKNYSCENTLLRLIGDLRASLDNKEVVAVILLDLSKAFDCVPHCLLLAKLKAYGVAKPGFALMRNYLTGRSQRVKMAPMFLPGCRLQRLEARLKCHLLKADHLFGVNGIANITRWCWEILMALLVFVSKALKFL